MLIVSVALLRAVRNFLTLKLDLTLILVHTKLRKVFSTKMYSNYDLLFYSPLYLFCLSFWDTLLQRVLQPSWCLISCQSAQTELT